MPTIWKQHDSMCGCSRCAREWERDNPQPVWDYVEVKSRREHWYCQFCGGWNRPEFDVCRCEGVDDYEDV